MNEIKHHKNSDPSNHKTTRNYLIGLIFSMVMIFIWSIPLTPVFIRFFIPFPSLERTTKITGRLEIDNTSRVTKNTILPSRYFVVNEMGRFEIQCGLPTEHTSCFRSDTYSQDSFGTVWVDPIFGVVQWDMEMQKSFYKGYKDHRSYSTEKIYFEKAFKYVEYINKALPLFIWLFAAIYFGINFFKNRNQISNSNQQA